MVDRRAPPPAPTHSFAAIAWHPDANDVWMDGNYLSSGGAQAGALQACAQVMGEGCEASGEWSNSTMSVIRNRQGGFTVGWTGEGGRDRRRVLEECTAKQILACEVFKTFDSRRDHYSPGPGVRVSHAVAVWVDGTEGNDRKLYIASGYGSTDEAASLALAACQSANPQHPCKEAARTSGGFIQTGTSDGNRDFSTVEMSASRARAAAQRLCARHEGVNCKVQSVYDSRRRGQFVHDFATGTAD